MLQVEHLSLRRLRLRIVLVTVALSSVTVVPGVVAGQEVLDRL